MEFAFVIGFLQLIDQPRLHKLSTGSSRPRFAAVEATSLPTNPAPTSIWKFTRSIELEPDSEILLAAVIVCSLDTKKFSIADWAIVALLSASCCKT